MAGDHQSEGSEAVKKKGKLLGVIICWILGNGSLFAWNSMLTITDYLPLSTLFCAYHEAKINTRLRIMSGYTAFILSTPALVVMNVATSGKGELGKFIGICIISGIFGFSDGLVGGGVVGDLSLMCPEFIQSFFAGQAASGAITSALRFITKAAFEKSKNGLHKGAVFFFSISTLVELVCIFLYAYALPKLPIVKYYREKAAIEGSKTVAADLVAAGRDTTYKQDEEDSKHQQRLSSKQLLQQNIDYAIDLYLIYVLTLSIFPGFLSEDSGSHSLGEWYALVLIAMYNVWDLIGRYVPLIKCIKITSRKGLTIAVLLRFLLIPAFYLTSKYGAQGWMILLTSFLGLSNGYLTVCAITEAPKGYKGPEQNALGNYLVASLLAGIFSGVVLDWLWLIGKGW